MMRMVQLVRKMQVALFFTALKAAMENLPGDLCNQVAVMDQVMVLEVIRDHLEIVPNKLLTHLENLAQLVLRMVRLVGMAI